jgi:hypothetical protein
MELKLCVLNCKEITENEEKCTKVGTTDYKDCFDLKETLSVNPYAAQKRKTQESWEELAKNVAAYGPKMQFEWKSIRDRVNLLARVHCTRKSLWSLQVLQG